MKIGGSRRRPYGKRGSRSPATRLFIVVVRAACCTVQGVNRARVVPLDCVDAKSNTAAVSSTSGAAAGFDELYVPIDLKRRTNARDTQYTQLG
jgi:hypothetical protein